MIEVTGPLKVWSNEEGRMHFMNVPETLSEEIKAQSLLVRRGFGSVRVEVTIDDVTWRTSVFPQKNGGYFLPVKMDVIRKTDISPGEDVTVRLALL
jgi:hypothetical protein